MPAETPSDPVETTDPAEEEAFEFTSLSFGDVLTVQSEDGNETSEVTVFRPKPAACKYEGISCTKPETGDRVVQVELTIENTGDTVANWGSDYFVIEYADGTQLTASEGNAYEYGPENVMDYDVKVRPQSTFRSTLVFEAPKGSFKILVLTNIFEGVPFAEWG